jgi:hypothetical protein
MSNRHGYLVGDATIGITISKDACVPQLPVMAFSRDEKFTQFHVTADAVLARAKGWRCPIVA